MSRWAAALSSAVGLAAALGLGACGSPPPGEARPPAAPRTTVASNVMRADYAGSKACEPCHAEIYAKWAASPMRRMTRRLAETKVDARFDGAKVPFHDDVVSVEEQDGKKYMRITSATHQTTTLFRVTKVIGGRYREDFVGVEVAGTGAEDKVIGDPNDEPVLPLSWVKFDGGSWRYKGYSVMSRERPRIERGRSWRQTCIFCHNTTPLLSTIYDDLLGPSAKTYQGSVTDTLLPASRRWSFTVRDDAEVAREVGKEVQLLTGAEPKTAAHASDRLAEAIKTTQSGFHEEHLVEVGIGCEACHGGSKDHVAHPERKPSYLPTSEAIAMQAGGNAAPTRAQQVNHVCARCHTVLFSRYPYTWEGGERRKQPGGSSINSGEARDFLLGHCAGQMACTSCHDPHTEDDKQKLTDLGTVSGNKVCLGCHQKFASGAALAAHSHHQPAGEGSACLGCHMPKKNTGLAYKLTRYHRIGSPTDKERVERDRPLECALCHADQSVAALTGTMERWYGKSYDRAALKKLYGDDLEKNVLESTLLRGKAHEQMTAAGVLGAAAKKGHQSAGGDEEKRRKAQANWLLPLLTVDYPLERYYAKDALESIEGRPLPVDLNADAATIARVASGWLAAPR